MCVEVDQRDRAVFFVVRNKTWIGNKVIATQQQRGCVLVQNLTDTRLHVLDTGQAAALTIFTITIIDNTKCCQGICFPWPGAFPGQRQRGIADGSRAESGAGTIGGCHIKRHAHDGHINAG